MAPLPIKQQISFQQVAAPKLSASQLAIVEKWQEEIHQDPELYNGKKIFCREVVGNKAMVYVGDYATRMALDEIQSAEQMSIGIGIVWCGVLLINQDKELLLSKRSQQVRIEPGAWFLSSAGGIEPGEDPQQAAARELQEELGVQIKVTYLGSLVGKPPYGLGMLYTASVAKDLEVILDPLELTEWGWFSRLQLPQPQAVLLQDAIGLLDSK